MSIEVDVVAMLAIEVAVVVFNLLDQGLIMPFPSFSSLGVLGPLLHASNTVGAQHFQHRVQCYTYGGFGHVFQLCSSVPKADANP